MVATQEWRILRSKLHFKTLEKVDILAADEWNKNSQSSLQACPEDHITSSSNKTCLLNAGWYILRIEVSHQIQPIGRSRKVLAFMDKMCSRSIFVGLFRSLGRSSEQPQVAEFISTGHCLVVHHGHTCRPSSDHIVCKRNQPIFLKFVDAVGDAFLHVAGDDATALCL